MAKDVNEPKVVTIKTKLCSLGICPSLTSDGKEFLAAITREGNLHTKTTIRSYFTALSGGSMAVQLVKEELERNNYAILNDCDITWERTTYPAGSIIKRLDGTEELCDTDKDVDHIVEVDLTPIAENLMLKYLEEHEEPTPGSIKERLLLKAFGVSIG